MFQSKIDNYTLRAVCIANDWYTCGTIEEYEKLFKKNRNGATVGELADDIYLHSSNAEKKDIFVKLLETAERRV